MKKCLFTWAEQRPSRVVGWDEGVWWALFSFLYFKKTKFQKYMLNGEIFKNVCLSPIQLAIESKCKKNLHLGPGAHGALNNELVKSI